MKPDELRGRRVALWGFGREGRSTLAFLRREIPDLEVTVLNDVPLPEKDRPEGVEVLVGAANQLENFDVIIKSPGVSLYRPEILRAQEKGTHFTSATRLWFAGGLRGTAKTVAVTGTKGKSTTASLITHLLRAAGQNVELRGNIGSPLLDPPSTPEAGPVDTWVIELSSYQTADLDAAADVAVLLNLYPEHLDWHGDVETYYRDKINLLEQQVVHDHGTVVLAQDLLDDPRLASKVRAPRHWEEVETTLGFPLRGAHNLANLRAALTVLDILGIAPPQNAAANFRGLPHRLSALGEQDGLLWVDDSISTTPQSAQAAVESFPGRPVTVLLGGYDRGIDYEDLARFLAARPDVHSLTLGASGPRIAEALRGAGAKVQECGDLETAVTAAREETSQGGVVLLSPAAPSYDQFVHFAERGETFRRLAFHAISPREETTPESKESSE